jgi:hypothetical protein
MRKKKTRNNETSVPDEGREEKNQDKSALCPKETLKPLLINASQLGIPQQTVA